MSLLRAVAALAAILTAMLLQGAVVSAVVLPLPVSLVAVLVAAVALVDGAGAGMSLGFVAGVLADLGSAHPLGVLALTWTAVGVAAGIAAPGRSVRRDAVTVGIVCGIASLLTGLLLTLTQSTGATAWPAVRDGLPAGALDAVLALALIPLARTFLRTEPLRAPSPALIELSVATRV
ncbi:MAG: rod shape-determining protein MreD [Actinomycetota bacterium]|nr:rod shape-determining protein MreD [Actinomycetota bacterium]